MPDKRTVRRTASRLTGAVFGLLLILGFVWFVRTMMGSKSNKPWRQVQVVQVIRPPPPPPDQPPPPPPEKTEQPLPKDEPEPMPDNQPAPADQPLGIDAQGSAGGDAFGLAARSGGSDLVGGSGSAPFAWYTNRIADAIRDSRWMDVTRRADSAKRCDADAELCGGADASREIIFVGRCGAYRSANWRERIESGCCRRSRVDASAG